MAPIQKRARQSLDDDGASTSSRMQQENAQRKKAKLSAFNSRSIGDGDDADGNDDNDGDASSSDSDMEDAPAHADTALPSGTQYEIDRDAGFVHLEDPDEDDLQAAISIEAARKKFIGDNRPAEAGIVEVITCINFMCHERLEVKLGPLINFVVGKNGSGKSALVAALQICFGVKASSTNRGTKLKDMIKNDRDSAMVQIQLANRGHDAFRPDQFGDSVIVERSFNRIGSSSFKLKSINGRTISTKKADVDDLVEHFQIQVDNPMSLLTQDKAKKFITASGPKDKYKFFIQGTQLEQLDTDYKLIYETAENLQARVYDQKNEVEVLKKRANTAHEKAKLVEKHAEMKKDVQRFSWQSAWAQVEREERELEVKAEKVEQARQAVAEAEATQTTKAADYEAADTAVTRAAEAIEQLEEEKTPLAEAEAEAKKEWDKQTEEMRRLKTEQRNIHEELRSANESVETARAKIAHEESRLEALNGGLHARKLEEIEDAKTLVEERKSALEQARHEIPRLQEAMTNADDAFNELQQLVVSKKTEIQRAENQLQELNSDRSNLMNGYHPSMVKLLARIRNDRGFSSMPIGPIGLQCRLLQPVWSDVLEASLGAALNGFVVTNSADQQRLSKLARECNCHTSVWCTNARPLSLKEPDEQFDTILRVLEIENDLVKNALIINAKIEQTILIKDETVAQKVLYDGAPPRNVTQCFSINTRKRGFPGIRMTAGKNDSWGPIKGRADSIPRMKTDVATQVAKQQDTLNDLRRELQHLGRSMREAQDKQDKCRQAVERQKKQFKDMKLGLQRAQDRLETLEEELRNDEVVDGVLEAQKKILEESLQNVELHQGSFEDSQNAIDDQNNKCTHLKSVFAKAKLLVTNYNQQIEKATDKQRRRANIRQISLQQKNDAIGKVEMAKALEQKAINVHAEQAKTVDDFIKGATGICPRQSVDPRETVDSLDKKITRLNEQLKAYHARQGGTDEQIHAKWLEAEVVSREAQKALKHNDRLLQVIKETVQDRMYKWRKFQKTISAAARMNFLYLLSERSFRGGLTFDHQNKLLGLSIEPDATRKSDKGRQTKTLSGGEKSFSSICLLLALWEAMGAPLRMLDEYDVFMDDVNRDVSTRMIISAARRSVGKQFVLITPNQIGKKIEKENMDVTFIQMLDPRKRGQQSIEESMSAA